MTLDRRFLSLGSVFPAWLRFVPVVGGCVVKVENLIALYNLGHTLGQFNLVLGFPQVTALSIVSYCAVARVGLDHILADDPLPFKSTNASALRLRTAIDALIEDCKQDTSKWNLPLVGSVHHQELKAAIADVGLTLGHELNAMPIWFVTQRRGYSVDVLINNAEQVFGEAEVDLPPEN